VKRIKVPVAMVYVPTGDFIMGESKDIPNGPEHVVWLDGYFIGKYEVTNAEFKAFLDATGYRPIQAPHCWSQWKDSRIAEGKENLPIRVTWEDAYQYCQWISRETGRDVRLPTEAQWEKAARGTKGFSYPWGNEWKPAYCNSVGIAASDHRLRVYSDGSVPEWEAFCQTEQGKRLDSAGNLKPVGSFPRGQSPYGCHDMAGNSTEWCADWFKADCYVKSPARNPEGPTQAQADEHLHHGSGPNCRVHRGGDWNCAPVVCKSTQRNHASPVRSFAGYRVVCRASDAR
jgi:formylglycine-generating enzyme required for sulfatase activity